MRNVLEFGEKKSYRKRKISVVGKRKQRERNKKRNIESISSQNKEDKKK